MTLRPGTSLGPYTIVGPLGAGGMGEVYRAHDTTLNRHVAIKVLPEVFSAEAERLARFEREAQLLAALNHPHIAQIYGLERARAEQSPAFLVMELVEGEDLSQRIARGAVPLDEALPIARQIAEALEAAHEQGIVHRDLKPANIKVRSDGAVKVLDFGLAKVVEGGVGTATAAAGLTQSPTLTSPMTAVGTVLGTAAYMAPEQARGRAVDRRADIWAFGCVFYEMLTGVRPFKGEDISDVLVAILRDEPDWTRLPVGTPLYVRALLGRCLQKDLQKRLPHIGVARLEFAEGSTEARVAAEPSRRPVTRTTLVGAIGALVAMTLTAIAFVPRPGVDKSVKSPLVRFQIQPPPGEAFPGANGAPRFAISPDGTRFVFGSALPGVRDQLWIRRLDSVEAEPLRGTESEPQGGLAVQQPFWSADSRFIGFFDELAHQLKKLDTQGGPVQIVCDLSGNQYSGSWNQDGTILFSTTDTKGIQRVPAGGGRPVQVTTLEAGNHELFHLWPQFLPDGRHFLYLATSGAEASAIYVGSIDAPDRTRLIDSDSMVRFAPPNQLLYLRGESLMAQELDLRRLTLVGQPAVVADSVARTQQGRLALSVADSGILVYAPGNGLADSFQIMRIDRNGREIPSIPELPTAADQAVELSPDAKRLAFTHQSGPTSDIWIYDFERRQRSRLTTDAAADSSPIWSPDGSRIIFRSNRAEGKTDGLYEKSVSGATAETLIFKGEAGTTVVPQTWSPDGKSIVFSSSQGQTAFTGPNLWVLPLEGDRKPFPYLVGPYRKAQAAFSPNGRWLAFTSNESGTLEVYVQPFPVAADGRWQVSYSGGRFPRWRRDGKELDYLDGKGHIVAVTVATETRFEVGKSEVISNAGLTVAAPAGATLGKAFGLTPDGQQFVLAVPRSLINLTTLTVVTNWTAGLKK